LHPASLTPQWGGADRSCASAFEANIGRYGIAPSSLVIEVSEEGLLPENCAAQRTVSHLFASESKLCWTTSARVGRLSNPLSVPVRWLKIDRRFTAEAHTRRSAAIIRAIVCLGEGLAATVVAEGVETAAERETVESLGVRNARGTYLPDPCLSMSSTWVSKWPIWRVTDGLGAAARCRHGHSTDPHGIRSEPAGSSLVRRRGATADPL
jgi:EAL domain-containing protein (putative c-di-GMP-specific phosphodiesterase class I)